jgi:hypothetical protein
MSFYVSRLVLSILWVGLNPSQPCKTATEWWVGVTDASLCALAANPIVCKPSALVHTGSLLQFFIGTPSSKAL